MNTADLSFLLEPPLLSQTAVLHIQALAPLSMVAGQPGAYYRSQPVPTEGMLYGMLENALGWHLGSTDRKQILNSFRKRARKIKPRPDWIDAADEASGSGFISLLRHHLRFEPPHFAPAALHFDDLWSQHLRDTGRSFFGGSRNYDHRLEPYITAARQGTISFGDRAEFTIRSAEELKTVDEGAKINYTAVRDRFPQYYVSPTPREYVLPSEPYRFRIRCTPRVAEIIKAALLDPAAPLYLGSNDGWVEVWWEDLP